MFEGLVARKGGQISKFNHCIYHIYLSNHTTSASQNARSRLNVRSLTIKMTRPNCIRVMFARHEPKRLANAGAFGQEVAEAAKGFKGSPKRLRIHEGQPAKQASHLLLRWVVQRTEIEVRTTKWNEPVW